MSKEKITLSINPTYQCNLRCNFCYLSVEQLSSKTRISPEQLFNKLTAVSLYREIEHVDLYGGEIALLPDHALNELLDIINLFYKDKVNIISNLTTVPNTFLSEKISLSVSWDFFARENFKRVYENMLHFKKDFSVLILATHKLVTMSQDELDEYISLLNNLPHLVSVEIKPYSKNKFNQHDVSFIQFENWVKKWIERSDNFKFKFINIEKIQASLSKNYSSWSDSHLYITPSGKYAALDFDEDNREFFLELESFSDYLVWTKKEKLNVSSNTFCSQCKYLGHCLSEHLQPVKDISSSCNGFMNLLDWYQNERL